LVLVDQDLYCLEDLYFLVDLKYLEDLEYLGVLVGPDLLGLYYLLDLLDL
jgi:hypothetical protein